MGQEQEKTSKCWTSNVYHKPGLCYMSRVPRYPKERTEKQKQDASSFEHWDCFKYCLCGLEVLLSVESAGENRITNEPDFKLLIKSKNLKLLRLLFITSYRMRDELFFYYLLLCLYEWYLTHLHPLCLTHFIFIPDAQQKSISAE